MKTKLPLVIQFLAEVDDSSVRKLISAVTRGLKRGAPSITLLMSTPGGGVDAGLTAYNYLAGLPVPLTTHNIGQVDSIGTVIFSAGKERLAAPTARFILHEVSTEFDAGTRWSAATLRDRAASIDEDQEAIASILARATGRSHRQVDRAMRTGTRLNGTRAVRWGLAHRTAAPQPGKTDVITIGE